MKSLMVGVFILITSCTPAERKEAVDIGKVAADMACLIGEAELSDEELKKVCNLTDELFNQYKVPALTARRKMLSRTAKKTP